MKRNIPFNEENKDKKQKLDETQQNSFLEVFDTNILSQILTGLTIPIISEEQDHTTCFSDCIAFSLTSKTCNLITKQSKFTLSILKKEKIENLNFNSYLKLKYILKQPQITDISFTKKEELLNHILFCASQNGIYNLIPILIQNGADVNFKNEMIPNLGFRRQRWGNIAFSYSCEKGYLKTSKILIENNSNINFIGKSGSMLYLACESGNLALVKYLIEEKKLDFNTLDRHNRNILVPACKSRNINLLKYLIDEKKLDINHSDEFSYTPIFEVCESGNLNLVKYLINETNCNFKYENGSNSNILFSACGSGNLDLVKYLVNEKKFNPNLLNGLDESVLWHAIWSKNFKLIDYLMDNFDMQINKLNDEGKPLLFRVVESGHLKLVNYLLDHGADPSCINDPDIIKQLEKLTGKTIKIEPKPDTFGIVQWGGGTFLLKNGLMLKNVGDITELITKPNFNLIELITKANENPTYYF